MIDVYAFLAMFLVQVVALSVMPPAMLFKRARAVLARYPVAQFPQLYPEGSSVSMPLLKKYRALNWLVAVVGLALLGWFCTYMQRTDWDDGPIEGLLAGYTFLQFVPLVLLFMSAAKINKQIRNSFPEDKRKATLRPRGLFDFVSPIAVFLALAGYVLYVAFVLYIDRHPFPGFAGAAVNIGMVTAIYALMGVSIYLTMYGRKSSPLQTQAGRMRAIGVAVKLYVYACLGMVVFISLNFTMVLLDLQHWEPFFQSAGNVVWSLAFLTAINGLPGEVNLDVLQAAKQP